MKCSHTEISASLVIDSAIVRAICSSCSDAVEMECLIPFGGRPYFFQKDDANRSDAHPANNPDKYFELFPNIWIAHGVAIGNKLEARVKK